MNADKSEIVEALFSTQTDHWNFLPGLLEVDLLLEAWHSFIPKEVRTIKRFMAESLSGNND